MNTKIYNAFNKHTNIEKDYPSLKLACEGCGLNYTTVRNSMSVKKKPVYENAVFILSPKK